MPNKEPPDTDQQDDDKPLRLTRADIAWVHERRQQLENEIYMRQQLRSLWPWVVGAVGLLISLATSLWKLSEWISKHVTI